MSKSILLSVAIVALFNIGISCSCLPATLQEHFESSDLTVIGRVVARFDNCPGGSCDPINDQFDGRFKYIVFVNNTIKGPNPEDKLLVVSTRTNSALCGVGLTVGKVYLLLLRNPFTPLSSCVGTEIPINICNGIYEWGSLSDSERQFINHQ